MNIKELRIGSTILVNGVRAKVVDLDTCHFGSKTKMHINVVGMSPETGEEMKVGSFADNEGIQPIPITEELLKELGFEDVGAGTFYKYYDEDEFCISINHLRYVIIWAIDKDRNLMQDLDSLAYCGTLHELETFLYLTTKKELLHL